MMICPLCGHTELRKYSKGQRYICTACRETFVNNLNGDYYPPEINFLNSYSDRTVKHRFPYLPKFKLPNLMPIMLASGFAMPRAKVVTPEQQFKSKWRDRTSQLLAKYLFSRDLPSSKKNSVKSHIEVMDGLRGIAILLVVIFHIWQLSWLDFTQLLHSPKDLNFIAHYGFLGVEVFFFISGFCLFYPHARYHFEQYPLASLRDYFGNRALKIFPSYYLAILLTLCLFTWEFSKDRLFGHLISHLFFFHNFSPETYYSINGVFWSLAVEVQFYLIFPFIARFFRKRPIIAALLMTVCAIAYRQYIVITDQEGGFIYTQHLNQMPAFLDLFAAGMLTAYFLVWLRNRQNMERYKRLFSVLMLLGLASFVALIQNVETMASQPDGMINWQASYRPLIGIVLILTVIGGHFANPCVQRLLNNRFLAFFSLISYNLYIWHQFIAAKLFNARFPKPTTLDPHDDPQWQVLFTFVAITVAILSATLLTMYWERPFLRRKLNPFQATKRE